jgi:hypothetical protein
VRGRAIETWRKTDPRQSSAASGSSASTRASSRKVAVRSSGLNETAPTKLAGVFESILDVAATASSRPGEGRRLGLLAAKAYSHETESGSVVVQGWSAEYASVLFTEHPGLGFRESSSSRGSEASSSPAASIDVLRFGRATGQRIGRDADRPRSAARARPRVEALFGRPQDISGRTPAAASICCRRAVCALTRGGDTHAIREREGAPLELARGAGRKSFFPRTS